MQSLTDSSDSGCRKANQLGEAKENRETRRWLKRVVLLLLLVVCVGYPFVKIQWARGQVRRFCEQTSIGMLMENLIL